MEPLLDRLKVLRAKKEAVISPADLDAVIATVGSINDFKAMAEKIRQTRADMSSIVSAKAGREHIEGANLELDEVIKATEEASNRIMDAAEKIQSLAAGNSAIAAQVTELFEACSFQDITGQRIRKVLGLLADIEKGIQHLVTTTDDNMGTKKPKMAAEKEKELLRGPQLSKDKPSQDDIDKLFANS